MDFRLSFDFVLDAFKSDSIQRSIRLELDINLAQTQASRRIVKASIPVSWFATLSLVEPDPDSG